MENGSDLVIISRNVGQGDRLRGTCDLENELKSVARVLERTIPTERPALVSEVSANVFG
jgi:hypothetical protein